MKSSPPFWLAIILFFSSSLSGFPQADNRPLSIDLSLANPDQTEITVGETDFLQLTFTNNIDTKINVIPPLDGSYRGRYPRYTINVVSPLPVKPSYPPPYCGTVNPLTLDDFIPIQPQQSHTLTEFPWLRPFIPLVAGEYKISYTIQFDSENEEFLGSLNPEYPPDPLDQIIEELNLVPRVDIQSPTLTLNVVSNGQTLDPKYHCLMGMPKAEIERMFSRFYHTEDPKKNFYTFMLYPRYISVHFNQEQIVDGVEYLYPGDIESALLWLRGSHDEIPHKVIHRVQQGEYDWVKSTITILRVGSMIERSAVNSFSRYQ